MKYTADRNSALCEILHKQRAKRLVVICLVYK